MAALPRRPEVPWTSLYPDAKPDAIDLLDKLLAFNPHRRINAVDALAHPYFQEYHDPLDEVREGEGMNCGHWGMMVPRDERREKEPNGERRMVADADDARHG